MQPPCHCLATHKHTISLVYAAGQIKCYATEATPTMVPQQHQENSVNAMPLTGIESKTRGHQLPTKTPINDRVNSKFFQPGLPAPEPCVELTCSPASLLATCLQGTGELLGIWRNQKMSVSMGTS